MALPKQSRNITIVGASGSVGSPILSSLLGYGIHNISVVTRPESKAEFPSSVKVHRGLYDDETFLDSVLAGQDVLILALNFNAYEAQVPPIKAAAKQGVKYIVPTEYGSDPNNIPFSQELSILSVKKPYRNLIEELGVSSWIGVVTNPWFDYCFKGGFLGIDLKNRTAALYDTATKANLATLDRVGQSLAALLTAPEDELARYKNDWVYFSSFVANHRDIFESALRVTGTKEQDWTVTEAKTLEVRRKAREAAAKGDMWGGVQSLFALTFTEGFGGYYGDKVFDYAKFGLEAEESLDEAMKKVAEDLGIERTA